MKVCLKEPITEFGPWFGDLGEDQKKQWFSWVKK